MKFYHTSGYRFKKGQVIGGPGFKTYLSNKTVPHSTIAVAIAVKGFRSWKEYSEFKDPLVSDYWDKRIQWNELKIGEKPEYPDPKNPKPIRSFVYEVRPYSKPVFSQINQEYYVIDDFVEIVKVVGSAKGLFQNHLRKYGEGKALLFADAFKH